MTNFITNTVLTLAAGVFLYGDTQHAERLYQRNGTNYIARFEYNPAFCFFPTTYPLGQPHYPATASLWAGDTLLSTNIPCQYTEKGCFEDSLDALLIVAGRQVFNTNTSPHLPPMTNVIVFRDLSYTNDIDLKEVREVMNELEPYIETIQPPPDLTLLYRTPAAELRNQADRIEQKDAVKARFKALLDKINKVP